MTFTQAYKKFKKSKTKTDADKCVSIYDNSDRDFYEKLACMLDYNDYAAIDLIHFYHCECELGRILAFCIVKSSQNGCKQYAKRLILFYEEITGVTFDVYKYVTWKEN